MVWSIQNSRFRAVTRHLVYLGNGVSQPKKSLQTRRSTQEARYSDTRSTPFGVDWVCFVKFVFAIRTTQYAGRRRLGLFCKIRFRNTHHAIRSTKKIGFVLHIRLLNTHHAIRNTKQFGFVFSHKPSKSVAICRICCTKCEFL